jgi:hypothetical protein
MGVGPPPRPCPSVDLATLEFASLPEDLQAAFLDSEYVTYLFRIWFQIRPFLNIKLIMIDMF